MMAFPKTRKKILAWLGLTILLLVGGYCFIFMLSYAALSASPNFPRDQTFYVLTLLGVVLLFCVIAVIALTIFLFKIYRGKEGSGSVS